MTPERWTQICAALDQALEYPEGERADFLARTYSDDSELQAEVLSLLNADTGAVRQLEQMASDLAESSPQKLKTGDRLGSWEIEELHALGGMSQIYRAKRAAGDHDRRVAIKILSRPSQVTPGPDRMKRELQILAKLEHPHIARLYDDGITADGDRYLVMELITGATIDRYCEERNLSLRACLELFIKICGAVQFAHSHLCVHRDLKPGNILVQADGEPKLLDFGVARILAEDGLEEPSDYGGSNSFTLTFASPQQIRRGLPSMSSDIYSLGVLLYRLLAGRVPFEEAPGKEEKLAARICHEEPTLPSVALLDQPAILGDAGKKTKQERERKARALRGDLDAIILKALSKRPLERYHSAQALAEDLRRYLTGRTVQARENTWGYRTGKLLRRQWRPIGATVVAFLLLLSFAVSTSFQQRQTERERDRAENIRDYLASLFESIDPELGNQGKLPARVILDQSSRRALIDLENEPEQRVDLLLALGGIYQNLGLPERALELLEPALEVSQKELAPGDSSIAEAFWKLGIVRGDLGEHKVAEKHFTEALSRERAQSKQASAPLGVMYKDLGLLYIEMHEPDLAEPALKESIAILSSLPNSRPLALADALTYLGFVHYERGEYEEVERLYQRSAELEAGAVPRSHPRTARRLHNSAQLRQRTGNLKEALELQSESVQILRESLGEDHPSLARALSMLGLMLRKAGQYSESAETLEAALAIEENVLGPEHPSVSRTLEKLANTYSKLDRVDDAEKALLRALAIDRTHLDEKHPTIASKLSNLGLIRLHAEKYEEATVLFQEALDILTSRYGEKHLNIAAVAGNLGVTHTRAGRLQKAETELTRSLAIKTEILGPDHQSVATTLRALGSLYLKQRRYGESEEAITRSLAIVGTRLGSEHSDYAAGLTGLAQLYIAQQRHSEAIPLYQEALAVLESSLGTDHPSSQAARDGLAHAVASHQSP